MFFSTAVLTKLKGGKFHAKVMGILTLLVQSLNVLYWRLAQYFPLLLTSPMDIKMNFLGFDVGLNTILALFLCVILTSLTVYGYKVKGETKVKTRISLKSSVLVSLWNVVIFPIVIFYLFKF